MTNEALRPAVVEMAHQMERVLRKNDWKGGWQNMTHEEILRRIKEEVAELESVIEREISFGFVRDEAIDVANFCMMLVDRIVQSHPRKFSATPATTSKPEEATYHHGWHKDCGVVGDHSECPIASLIEEHFKPPATQPLDDSAHHDGTCGCQPLEEALGDVLGSRDMVCATCGTKKWEHQGEYSAIKHKFQQQDSGGRDE